MRRVLVVASITMSLFLVGCGDEPAEPSATDAATETAEPVTPTPTPTPDQPSPTPETEEPGWPTDDVSAPFTGTVPTVPTLVDLRIGTHPEDGYDRVAFEFDALPGYRIGYQPRIVYDATGETVDLPGATSIQLVFNPAQAHDDEGNPTLESPPVEPVEVGYPALEAYVLNGDFEGYLSIALGLNAEAGFRVGRFTAENGNNVIYIDLAQP
jgi:hypothetical protein